MKFSSVIFLLVRWLLLLPISRTQQTLATVFRKKLIANAQGTTVQTNEASKMIHKFLVSVLFTLSALFTAAIAQAQTYTFDGTSWSPWPSGPNPQAVAFNYLGNPLPWWSWGQNVRFRVTSPELLAGNNGHFVFALNYKYNNDPSAGPIYNHAMMVTVGNLCDSGGVRFEAKWPTPPPGDADAFDPVCAATTAGESSVLINFSAFNYGDVYVEVWDSTGNRLLGSRSYYLGGLFPTSVGIPQFAGYGFAMIFPNPSNTVSVELISRTILGDRDFCSPTCR